MSHSRHIRGGVENVRDNKTRIHHVICCVRTRPLAERYDALAMTRLMWQGVCNQGRICYKAT